MIIRIIATALIQCTMRTHAGWITLAGGGGRAFLIGCDARHGCFHR